MADGSAKSKTPGILSDSIDFEVQQQNQHQESTSVNPIDEFPILDELDRLAKVSFSF